MKSAKEQWSAAEADEGITYAEKGMLKERFPPDQICGMARKCEFLALHDERFDKEFRSIAGDNGGAVTSFPGCCRIRPLIAYMLSVNAAVTRGGTHSSAVSSYKNFSLDAASPDNARASETESALSLGKALSGRFGG